MHVYHTALLLLTCASANAGPSGTEDIVHATVTKAAQIQDLRVRDGATCAYVSGNPASPLTCPESYSCGQRVLNFNCCNSLQCVDDWRTCYRYGDSMCGGNLSPEQCSAIYTSILSCSPDAPYCFRYMRYSQQGAANTWHSWACGTSASPTTVIALINPTAPGTVIASNPTSRSQTPANTASQEQATTAPDPIASSPPSATATNAVSSNAPSRGPVLSVGAIAGIGVAGAVILAALGYLAFTYIRTCVRKRRWIVDQRKHNDIRYEHSRPDPSLAGGYDRITGWNLDVAHSSHAPPTYEDSYRLSTFPGSPVPQSRW